MHQIAGPNVVLKLRRLLDATVAADEGAGAASEVPAQAAEAGAAALAQGTSNVGTGFGHFAWDFVAVPADFARAEAGHGGPRNRLSYYAPATAAVLKDGVPAEELQNEAAKNVGTQKAFQ